MPGMTETKGRCLRCKRMYQWTGKPRLCDAVCPKCADRLQRCRALDPGLKIFEKPVHAP